MKAVYICKLTDKTTKEFEADTEQSIGEIKFLASKAFGIKVLDLLKETLVNPLDAETEEAFKISPEAIKELEEIDVVCYSGEIPNDEETPLDPDFLAECLKSYHHIDETLVDETETASDEGVIPTTTDPGTE